MDKRINIETERAAFEAWVKPLLGAAVRTLDYEPRPEGGYWHRDIHARWEGWLAARRATPPATGAMDLPPLPDHILRFTSLFGAEGEPYYTARQMKQYAREAIAHYLRKQAGQECVPTFKESLNKHLSDLKTEIDSIFPSHIDTWAAQIEADASKKGRAYQRKVDEKIMARRAGDAVPQDQNQTTNLNVLRPFAAPASQHDADARDAAQWREMLAAVIHEIPNKFSRDDGNAPGHSHRIPGIWDSDNGAKAGKECAWCKVWNAARSALAVDEELAAGAARQGGDTNTPLAYIPPHIMESLRNGCRVGTVLEPKPENGCTEALYGR